MNWKHLIWIIPISLIIGLIIGNEIFVCHRDNAPDNNQIENLWDCHDGCLYAEWVQYGYKNLSSPSELYYKCAEACWYGEDVLK